MVVTAFSKSYEDNGKGVALWQEEGCQKAGGGGMKERSEGGALVYGRVMAGHQTSRTKMRL